jgi:hypothetical protein
MDYGNISFTLLGKLDLPEDGDISPEHVAEFVCVCVCG